MWVFRRPHDYGIARQGMLESILISIATPLLVTPAVASVQVMAVDPIVVIGSLNITPAVDTVAVVKVDPTVSLVLSPVCPDPSTVAVVAANPTVVLGYVTVTPAARTIANAKVDPTVNYGDVSVTPGVSTVASVTIAPTVLIYYPSVAYTPDPATVRVMRVNPIIIGHLWHITFANKGPGWKIGDLLIAQRLDFDKYGASSTVFYIEAVVELVDVDTVTGDEYAVINIRSGEEYLAAFLNEVEWVVIGNEQDPARAAVIYLTADETYSPRIDLRSGVTSHAAFGSLASLRATLGNLQGITDANFGVLTGYGLYTENAYLKGTVAGGSATSLTAGAGYWMDKPGNWRVGDPATNKYLMFNVATGNLTFGSAVTLNWTNIAGLPARFADAPSGSGLYVTSSYMGYYDGGYWKTYMDSAGHFYLGGIAGALQWSGSALTIAGYLPTGQAANDVNSHSVKITAGCIQIYGASTLSDWSAGADMTKIDGGKIYTNSITASQIAAGTIVAGNIAAGTITGALIAAGTIIASNIMAGTITADKLSVSTLSAISANLGTVTAGSITGITITGTTITGSTLTTAASGARILIGTSIGYIQVYSGTSLAGNIFGSGTDFTISAGAGGKLDVQADNGIYENGYRVWTTAAGYCTSAYGGTAAADSPPYKRVLTINGVAVHVACYD